MQRAYQRKLAKLLKQNGSCTTSDFGNSRRRRQKFVVLRVPSGQETPYYYTGDGNRIAYVRIGNESVPASAVDLKRLVFAWKQYVI